METNYYTELIRELNALLQAKQLHKAKTIIQDELKAPYIPGAIRQQLEELSHQIWVLQSQQASKKHTAILPPEAILAALEKPLASEEAVGLVYDLSKFNLRHYLKSINNLLVAPAVSNATKTHLCFLLYFNDLINHTLIKKHNRTFLIINKADVTLFEDCQPAQELIKVIDDMVASDDIDTYNLAIKLVRIAFDDIFPAVRQLTPAASIAPVFVWLALQMQNKTLSKDDFVQQHTLSKDQFDANLANWSYIQTLI